MDFIQCQRLSFLLVSSQFRIVIIGLIITISLASLIVNILLIYALCKTKQLMYFSNLFMVTLCSSDICFAAVTQPMLVVHHVNAIYNKENCLLEFLIAFTSHFFLYFAFFLLIDIAMFRYLNSTKLNFPNLHVNRPWPKILITINLATSLFVALAASAPKAIFFQVQVVFTAIGTVSITVICYLYSVVLRRMAFRVYPKHSGTEILNTQTIAMQKQAIKTIQRLMAAVVVLYTPYNILGLIRSYWLFYRNVYPGDELDIIASCAYFPAYLFTIANAVIYGLGSTPVRNYYFRIFRAVQK